MLDAMGEVHDRKRWVGVGLRYGSTADSTRHAEAELLGAPQYMFKVPANRCRTVQCDEMPQWAVIGEVIFVQYVSYIACSSQWDCIAGKPFPSIFEKNDTTTDRVRFHVWSWVMNIDTRLVLLGYDY